MVDNPFTIKLFLFQMESNYEAKTIIKTCTFFLLVLLNDFVSLLNSFRILMAFCNNILNDGYKWPSTMLA